MTYLLPAIRTVMENDDLRTLTLIGVAANVVLFTVLIDETAVCYPYLSYPAGRFCSFVKQPDKSFGQLAV